MCIYTNTACNSQPRRVFRVFLATRHRSATAIATASAEFAAVDGPFCCSVRLPPTPAPFVICSIRLKKKKLKSRKSTTIIILLLLYFNVLHYASKYNKPIMYIHEIYYKL